MRNFSAQYLQMFRDLWGCSITRVVIFTHTDRQGLRVQIIGGYVWWLVSYLKWDCGLIIFVITGAVYVGKSVTERIPFDGEWQVVGRFISLIMSTIVKNGIFHIKHFFFLLMEKRSHGFSAYIPFIIHSHVMIIYYGIGTTGSY